MLSSIGEGDTEAELQGLLENMMAQLMNKDVLYEPLKELNEKVRSSPRYLRIAFNNLLQFPGYLAEHKATLKPEDKKRYESQQRIVTEVLAIFEDPSYNPDDEEQGVRVVTLMNAVCPIAHACFPSY